MIVIAPPDHARHDPDAVLGAAAGGRPYWERAARADALLAAVRDAGLAIRAPRDAGIAK